jgi:peptidoglycan/LPS O-acetylase OafA/YrhL
MNPIPTLDGRRGIAIAMLLSDHLQNAFLGRLTHPRQQTGQHGVTIFFVLSGFLKLWREPKAGFLLDWQKQSPSLEMLTT